MEIIDYCIAIVLTIKTYCSDKELIKCMQSMPPHPDICYLGHESGCCWYRRWVSDSSYD